MVSNFELQSQPVQNQKFLRKGCLDMMCYVSTRYASLLHELLLEHGIHDIAHSNQLFEEIVILTYPINARDSSYSGILW